MAAPRLGSHSTFLLEPLTALFFLLGASRLLVNDGAVAGRRAPAVAGGNAAPARSGVAAQFHAAVGLVIAVEQAVVLLLKTDTEVAVWQSLGSFAIIVVLLVLLPSVFPHFFERHLTAIRTIARIAWFSQPYMRQSWGIPHVLKNAPSTRRLGLLRDLFSITLGTRTLGLINAGVMFSIPLLPGLALLLFALLLCRDPLHMCALPLLASPAWAARVRAVHRAVYALPLGVPRRGLVSSSPLDDCRVALVFYQLLLGVMAPTLFVFKFQAASSKPTAAAAEGAWASGGEAAGSSRQPGRHRRQRSSGSEGSSEGSNAPQGCRQLATCASSCCSRVRRLLLRAAHEADASLRHLCEALCGGVGPTGSSRVLMAAIAWLLMLSLLWSAAMVLEPPLDLPPGHRTAAAALSSAATPM